MGEKNNKETMSVPPLLQAWRALSTSLPKITLPLGPGRSPLDFSVTVTTALVLGAMHVTFGRLLVEKVGFPGNGEKVTTETTASLVSIFHSTNLVVALGHLFATHRYAPSGRLTEAPLWWQEACHAVLQFCTGYMITDALAMIVNAGPDGISSSDWMFLGHHAATILYMTSTRMVGAGHFSAMICMLTGEFTNPFHNAFYIARHALTLDCCNGVWMQNFEYVNTFVFCLTYCIFRTFICPGFGAHILYDSIVRGWKNVPIWLLILWNFLIWGVLLGSIPWIIDCWNTLTTKYFVVSDSPEL